MAMPGTDHHGRQDCAAETGVVVVIDDHALSRQWVAQWLSESGYRVLPFAQVEEAARALNCAESVELVVVNLGASTASDPGMAAAFDRLLDWRPGTPVVVLSDRRNVAAVVDALRLGVRGYIPTTLDSHVGIEALHFIHAGGTFVPPDLLLAGADGEGVAHRPERGEGPNGLIGLTPRELEVLDRLQQGKRNKTIAHQLDLQESTVKVHVRRIMKKLKATNRTEAAYLANRLNGTLNDWDAPTHPHAGSEAEAGVLQRAAT